MKRIKFAIAYFDHDEYDNILLYFLDPSENKGLYFDGIDFYYKNIDCSKMNVLHGHNPNYEILEVLKVENHFLVRHILLSNGIILRITCAPNNNREGKWLSVIKKEDKVISDFGKFLYDKILDDLNELDEASGYDVMFE